MRDWVGSPWVAFPPRMALIVRRQAAQWQDQMPAKRKYSDAQRAEMFRLHEQGYTAGEIARQCQLGTASTASFEIPRRTVAEIVTRMERQRGGRVPRSLDDAADPEAIAATPTRVLRILHRQLDRFDEKTRQGKSLSLDDMEIMKTATAIIRDLERRGRPPASDHRSPIVTTPQRGEARSSTNETSALRERR